MNAKQAALFELILEERARQDRKWGIQRHAPEIWLAILGEEFGELAKGLLEWRFGSTDTSMREELVQTIAVGVAMLESLDRGDHFDSMVVSGGGNPGLQVDEEMS